MMIDSILQAFQCDDSCEICTHPSGQCSGSCQSCLDEIHWGPNDGKRVDYDCDKLIHHYVQSYTNRYYQNIKFACQNIDFGRYPLFSILSIGCGTSPDLMAFADFANGREVRYNGIDRNVHWDELHCLIQQYVAKHTDFSINYENSDIFQPNPSQTTEVYNVAVIQFLISSILNTGGSHQDIIALLKGMVNSAVRRWADSSLNSPFLFILNDVDSMNKGRNCFYRLLDILEEQGYHGVAYAFSEHETGDLGAERWSDRKDKGNFGAFVYLYSQSISNNSATLVIEVNK